MTREEAIKILTEYFDGGCTDFVWDAYQLAIKALQAQDVDAISRQAVLWMLTNLSYNQCKTQGEADLIDTAKTMVMTMPSAQPEIIHCTECKHYREYDSKYVENAVVVQCMADRYPISETIPDGWFCAGAERKK